MLFSQNVRVGRVKMFTFSSDERKPDTVNKFDRNEFILIQQKRSLLINLDFVIISPD